MPLYLTQALNKAIASPKRNRIEWSIIFEFAVALEITRVFWVDPAKKTSKLAGFEGCQQPSNTGSCIAKESSSDACETMDPRVWMQTALGLVSAGRPDSKCAVIDKFREIPFQGDAYYCLDPDPSRCGFDLVLDAKTVYGENVRLLLQLTTARHEDDKAIQNFVEMVVTSAAQYWNNGEGVRSVAVFAAPFFDPVLTEATKSLILTRIGAEIRDKRYMSKLNKERIFSLVAFDKLLGEESTKHSFMCSLVYWGDATPFWDELKGIHHIVKTKNKEALKGYLAKQLSVAHVWEKFGDPGTPRACDVDRTTLCLTPFRLGTSMDSRTAKDMDFTSLLRYNYKASSNELVRVIRQHKLSGLCFFAHPKLLMECIPELEMAVSQIGVSWASIHGVALAACGNKNISLPADVALRLGGSDSIARYLAEWKVDEPEVNLITRFLRGVDERDIWGLTVDKMATCSAALGTKLAVLAVIQSVQAGSASASVAQQEARPQKRRATNMDEVCQALLQAVSDEDVQDFREKVAKKCRVGSLPTLTPSFLVKMGLNEISAELIAAHIARALSTRPRFLHRGALKLVLAVKPIRCVQVV